MMPTRERPAPVNQPDPAHTVQMWYSNKRKATECAEVWQQWWPLREVTVERNGNIVEYVTSRPRLLRTYGSGSDSWSEYRYERRRRMVRGYMVKASPERDPCASSDE